MRQPHVNWASSRGSLSQSPIAFAARYLTSESFWSRSFFIADVGPQVSPPAPDFRASTKGTSLRAMCREVFLPQLGGRAGLNAACSFVLYGDVRTEADRLRGRGH